MKHFKLFFACALMSLLSLGQVWATDYYVKVTSAPADWAGDYLIVYEPGNVAFDGSLTTLDAVENTQAVTISDGKIEATAEMNAIKFTISADDSESGWYQLKSASGYYIAGTQKTSNAGNGLKSSNAEANKSNYINQPSVGEILSKSADQNMTLRYNSASNQLRFRYYKSGQQAIALYKFEAGGGSSVTAPTFTPNGGSFLGTQSVTLAQADSKDIYYTTNGDDPTTDGTLYSDPFTLTATTTVKAAAKDGSDWSSVVSKTFTKLDELTTMQAIFDKATAVGTTATDVSVTFNNWVVTGVKNSNAYVTDGTKGFIIYTSSHGFSVGDILSGTATCKVQLYKGSAELTELPATKVTVNTGGSVTPVVLDDAGITALTGANTGSVIKISGECSYESSKYYIGGVQLYNSLYSFSVSGGTSYECTGVYVQYNSTKEILPRSAADIVETSTIAVTGVDMTESTASVEAGETVTLHASIVPGNATNKTIVWSVQSGDTYASVADGVVTGIAAGTAVIRAASDEDASIYDECTVTVTAADPTKHKVTFDATVDKTADESDVTLTKSNVTIAMTEGTGRFNNGTDYRPWKSSVFTVSCSAGNITKIEFTCTSSKPISGFEDPEVGNLEKDGNNGVWTGNAASVSFTASNAQVQITTLTITYQEDSRAEAGLAWDPSDDIELTVGDAFTAPTLLNPNSIDAAEITIESSNPSLATVTAGVVSLVTDATGTATITATFAGNASYKPATISYDITVNAAAVVLTDYYEKVTSTANIVEGTYLIVYEEGSVAFNGGLTTLDAESNTIDVAITTDDKIGVTPATEAATFYIDPAAGTIKSASDHYIGVSSWGNGLKQTDTYVHNVLEIDGAGDAQIGIYNAEWNTTGGTMLLQYNKSAGQTRFRYYKNGGQQPIALYKLHDEVIKPAAGLAWDPSDDIEITVGDAFTAPTLLNPNSIDAAEITIESSNPSVATVTAGVVALVADATGTTTITATFAGNASYKPATVSYTIKVNPASVSENVVILAVYDTKYYAMSTTNANNGFTAIAVEYDGSQVTVNSAEDKAAIQWTKKTSGDNTTFQDADDKYMKSADGATMSLQDVVCNWVWDATGEYYKIDGTNRTFFYQNTSGGIFKNYATSNFNNSGYSGKAEVIVIDPANIVISSKVSAELAYDPASDEITQGDAWSAPTLGYVVGFDGLAAITYASDNEAVATVTDAGVITLAGGTGTANITASFDGNASYKAGSATYTIIVNAPAPVLTGTTYTKVTSTGDITDGEYLIVYETENVAFNGDLATLDAAHNTVDVVISGSEIAGTADIDAAVFTLDVANGTIQAHNGNYIGVTTYGNGLKQNAEVTTYPAHTFEIDGEGNAIISIYGDTWNSGGEGYMILNYNDGASDKRFRYYKAGSQKKIQLYKKVVPVVTPETVRTGLEINRYYTVCLPKKITSVTGGTFWTLTYKDAEPATMVYIEEATPPFAAGKPYIFQATATSLQVVCEGDATDVAGTNGALVGTLADLDAAALAAKEGTIYLLIQNALRPNDNNYLSANRAYIRYDLLTVGTPVPAPGKRVRTMPLQGQTITGIDELNTSETPAKLMINGQLFILRGEKMYDAQGRLVK